MDLTRLRHLGFPLDSELHPGKAVIYVDPDIGMRSCTKAGGDLNSLEFCVDDFSSSDTKPASISTTSISPQLHGGICATSPQLPKAAHTVPDTCHIDNMQIEQDDGLEQGTNVVMAQRSSIIDVNDEESQTNTQHKNETDENLYHQTTGTEDTETLFLTEEDHSASSLACEPVNQPQSSGILDVNAQEFVPGSSITPELLNIASRDSTSAPVSLSANAKAFYPSSSYSNPSPLSTSMNASENEVEDRECARCDKVRIF